MLVIASSRYEPFPMRPSSIDMGVGDACSDKEEESLLSPDWGMPGDPLLVFDAPRRWTQPRLDAR
jgi:hypothetical protein